MHVEMARLAWGIAPEVALDWWTDFREGPSDHAFVPGASRHILEAHPDGSVEVEERMRFAGIPFMTERWRGRREGNAFRFEGTNTYATFHGAYVFEAAEDGTRVRLDAVVDLRPALRWSAFLARPLVHAILKADMRGHVKHMERDLAPAGRRGGRFMHRPA